MSGFKAVGTKVYAGNGALVRRFDRTYEPERSIDWMDDLHNRIRKARRFTAALNGTGPKHEWAKRRVGI